MKKVAITQDLCRMVELMLKGGAKPQEIGERLGISKTTVSRIKTAGFDAEQYRKNTTERVEKENLAEKDAEGIQFPLKVEHVTVEDGGVEIVCRRPEEQVPGQISMDLQPAEEQKAEMSEQTKLMRFIAGQVDKRERNAQIYTGEIITHLAKIEDYLAQILRKMDG